MGSRSTASAAGGTRRSRTAGPRVTGAHWLKLVGQREASRQQRMVEPPPGMMQMGRVRLQWGVAQTIVGIFKGIKKFQQNVATRTGNASEPPRPLQVSRACHRHGAQWASILLPKTATVRAAGSGPRPRHKCNQSAHESGARPGGLRRGRWLSAQGSQDL